MMIVNYCSCIPLDTVCLLPTQTWWKWLKPSSQSTLRGHISCHTHISQDFSKGCWTIQFPLHCCKPRGGHSALSTMHNGTEHHVGETLSVHRAGSVRCHLLVCDLLSRWGSSVASPQELVDLIHDATTWWLLVSPSQLCSPMGPKFRILRTQIIIKICQFVKLLVLWNILAKKY